MTEASQKGVLQHVLGIWYLVQFQQEDIQALLDSGSEVNAMTPAYAEKLSLTIQKIDVGTQKIDGSTQVTYEMVLVGFSV